MSATEVLTSSRCSTPSDIRAQNLSLAGCLQLSINARYSTGTTEFSALRKVLLTTMRALAFSELHLQDRA
jgi:hypothetical protein